MFKVAISPDVCCQGVQTHSDDFFSEARFLSDYFKVHYCTRFPGGEIVRLVFKFVLGSFSGGEKRFAYMYSKSLIIVLQKLKTQSWLSGHCL